MNDGKPVYKKYVVTSPVTVNPAGPDELPIYLEMEEKRGEIGLKGGYLELAPREVVAAVTPEPVATDKKPAAAKGASTPSSGSTSKSTAKK